MSSKDGVAQERDWGDKRGISEFDIVRSQMPGSTKAMLFIVGKKTM